MDPLATFYRLVPGAMMPTRAERSALGTLPVAALQYCEAITSASAYGWYAFPPISFHVQWDGTNFIWTHDDGSSWSPVRSEHAPGFADIFDAHSPADLTGFAPPMVTASAQPGVLQVWTGVMIRTRAGWSSLVRPPANLPRSRDYEPYEGIIETDRWFYPLFINLRIISADRPIFFDGLRPLLQVQPLKRETYEDHALQSAQFLDGVGSLTPRDWDDYRASLGVRGKDPMALPGRYSREVRKAGSRPHQIGAGEIEPLK
jgi:hypothetical protein